MWLSLSPNSLKALFNLFSRPGIPNSTVETWLSEVNSGGDRVNTEIVIKSRRQADEVTPSEQRYKRLLAS
jgi:hypothetical protein